MGQAKQFMVKNTPDFLKSKTPERYGNTIAYEVLPSELVSIAHDLVARKGFALKLITATDERVDKGSFFLWYLFGRPGEAVLTVLSLRLTDSLDFPSLTARIHAAWNYEKRIRTFFGLNPVGHPDAKPALLQDNWPADVFPLRKDVSWMARPKPALKAVYFQKVKGEGIYEIPVGPIHAGIIEPGHFRFSVAGEEIMLLEPHLGYTHKGVEKLFEHLPLDGKVRLSEKISGDSSFSHSMALCHGLEQLGQISVNRRARYLRLIYAELERLANHFGDIGAITLDAGFNFGGSQGARLREKVMRINERLTGSRFLRGVNAIGGVTKDIGCSEKERLVAEITEIERDFSGMIVVLENSASLLNRLKGTGKISRDVAGNHHAVGIAARAVGMSIDTRIDFPYAAYDDVRLGPAAVEQDGDVYARYRVRVKEAVSSMEIILKALQDLPDGPIAGVTPPAIFAKNAIAVSLVEGWRGEILYFIRTDARGAISLIVARDPSVINWSLLEYAALGNIVPDFPLINKSFNLSYSGNDG
jgi:Ni,Fe-hydrogenase III large subunit/Ni,Fe-hydrogenase III component G